jgi:exodeoxyribonuclease VII small subunit
MAAKQKELKFEQSLSQLEEIVDSLERGSLTLDESLDVFQRGIELSKVCSRRLDEAERKITILMQDEKGNIIEKPFETNMDAD